jgi:hypothetical protein
MLTELVEVLSHQDSLMRLLVLAQPQIPLGKEPRLHLLHLQQKKRLGLFPLNIRQVITEILRFMVIPAARPMQSGCVLLPQVT